MEEPAKRSKILDAAIASVAALSVYADFDGARSESLIFEGQARVEDNATLVIWGQRIRLDGIIVPRSESVAGRAGMRYLEHLISAVTVRCVTSKPFYRAVVSGRCYAGNVDIGAALVETGHAREREQASRK